ncbi:MAG: PKD domain-containing protein [Candidatus Bathyarchaeia archaeon]|jgi:PKD repeat protein
MQTKIHPSKKFSAISIIIILTLAALSTFITYTFVMGSTNDGSNPTGGDNNGLTPVSNQQETSLFASFTFSAPIINYNTSFIDTSTAGSSKINQWSWNFGDGATSAEQNPQHIYSTIGLKTVSLTVTDAEGKSSTTTKTLYVESLDGFMVPLIRMHPYVEFSVSTVNPTVFQQVSFTDKSVAVYGKIVQWSWTFGDGETSSQQNPAHVYSSVGIKTVTLTVTDSNGMSSTVTKTLTVEEAIQLQPPQANFSPASVNPTVNQDVLFTDTSSAGTGVINQWLWSFGDGTTSTEQNPTHAYSTIGAKTITLTVTDSNGLSNTITKAITVEKAPTAEFTVSSVNPTILEQVRFTDTSTEGSGVIISWLWTFGDGETSTIQNPTHSYSAAGLKVVTLTVTDSNGKISTVTHELTVKDFTAKTPIWSGTVWSASDMRSIHGDSVTSTVLEAGKVYEIEVSEMFWYNTSAGVAADAMYYTTDASNSWDWTTSYPAPEGHSFLQINGQDVNWGSLSNGDTGHAYTITYIGQDQALTFQLVDWMDSNYDNNYCHLPITIYLLS